MPFMYSRTSMTRTQVSGFELSGRSIMHYYSDDPVWLIKPQNVAKTIIRVIGVKLYCLIKENEWNLVELARNSSKDPSASPTEMGLE